MRSRFTPHRKNYNDPGHAHELIFSCEAVRYLREHAPEWLPHIRVTKRDRVRHHFWQKGGGFDRNIVEPRTLLQMIDTIHLNPVRRGLV